MKRRTFVRGLGAGIALGPAAFSASAANALGPEAVSPHLTRIHQPFLITAKEAQAWHVAKDSLGGPTLAGSPSWKNFLEITERELRARGVTDVFRNAWTYDRWFTSDWPDDTNWTLTIDGKKIRVASYGANSGMTAAAGVTGALVAYRQGMSGEALKGKIVVIPPGPPFWEVRGARAASPFGDYEYLSEAETFPNPLVPNSAGIGSSPFGRMNVQGHADELQKAGAAGMLWVVDLSYEALAGTYNFPVPARYNLPTLLLDREAGAEAIAAANSGTQATLRLIAQTEKAAPYQLFGFLPGKHYGTPAEEQVMLVTHTDGPSISQDNGAFGILGIVHYLSQIPQTERPRTVMIFLDARHYMPGAERAFAEQDYAAKHPDFYKSVVAAVGIEHLGQVEYLDLPNKPRHRTGQPEPSTVWVTNNQALLDLAIAAVKDNGLKRVQVQCPGRKGMHGGDQGPWYGLGAIAGRIGVPGSATMGSMTGYWSTRARIEALDAQHFVTQVATMAQITGALLTADMAQLRPQGKTSS
ncbi:MAG TPA: hypothetical protein VGG64_22360 [Pirellulales bacterium]|jgi:hypothetical protein